MDFALQYALKEIKKRPTEFLPILLAAFGVLVLIFNIIIFTESLRVKSINYYRLDFEIKLFEMPDESIKQIEALSYVKSAKSVNGAGNSNMLYIAFNPPHDASADAVFEAFGNLVSDIDLWEYPYYQSGWHELYMKEGFTRITFRYYFRNWFNSGYIDALLYNYAPMAVITITSSLLMAAVMVLVFGLKLKKNINEYAALRSLGMTAFDIMKINMFQGIGILLLCTPVSFGIAALTMKLVCAVSHNIYPEIKDDTPLIYVLPIQYIIAAAAIITVVSALALLLVSKFYNRKTIVELISGTGFIIPYVEKSSDKFEKARDFSYYGKIYRKRSRETYLPTNMLYAAMLIFPLVFVYAIFLSLNNAFAFFNSAEPKLVYWLRSDNNIPESMADEIREIEGVTEILNDSYDIGVFAEKGREEEVIRQIEHIVKIESNFENIYGEMIYGSGLRARNEYLIRKKIHFNNIFGAVFYGAQIAFLFTSSAFIMSAVNNFNISKRRREFAVIRALGGKRAMIINSVKKNAVINAVFVAAIAIIISFIFVNFMDVSQFATFEERVEYIFDYYVKSYFVYIFTFGFVICVNFISSLKSVKAITGENLINDIKNYK